MNQADKSNTSCHGRRRKLGLKSCKNTLFFACALFFTSTFLHVAEAAVPEKFVFGTNTEEQAFTGLWTRLIYTEAFKRLGVRLEIVVAPLKRLELLLERGEIDGEMVRAPAYGALHPRLIAIDVPIMQVVFGIYALKPIAGLNSLDDIRNGSFRGVYNRGVVFCENTLSRIVPTNRLDIVSSAKQGMDMLAIGHGDFFCDVSSGMLNYEFEIESSKSAKPIKLFDISKQVANKPYLHQKHTAFAVRLTAVLKQMEKEGLIEKYRLETVTRLTRQ
jgi:hypothetical protein